MTHSWRWLEPGLANWQPQGWIWDTGGLSAFPERPLCPWAGDRWRHTGRWTRDCKPGVRSSHTQWFGSFVLETSARQGTIACSGPKRPVREMLPGPVSPFPALLPSCWLSSVNCSKQVYAGPCKIKYYWFKHGKSSRHRAQGDGMRQGKHGGCGSVDTPHHHSASHPPTPFHLCRHWCRSKHPRLCCWSI